MCMSLVRYSEYDDVDAVLGRRWMNCDHKKKKKSVKQTEAEGSYWKDRCALLLELVELVS